MIEVFVILFFFPTASPAPLGELKNKEITMLERPTRPTCDKLRPFKKIPTPWIKIDKNSN